MTKGVAALRATAERLHDKAIRHRKALEWAEGRIADLRGTSASADGTVRVTVDQTGMLTGVELAPEALRDLGNTELARVITAVARQAAADAREQVRATYQGLVDEGTIRELPRNLLPAPTIEPDHPARAEPDDEPHSWLRDAY